MKHLLIAVSLIGLALTGQALAGSPCPPGFAVLQASDTCVRISGSVRSDALAGSGLLNGSNSSRIQSGARLQIDVRKQTDYGPLRAVIAVGNLRR
ncbi:hypothetical protein FHR70_003617 [Microvirga lupini]|uniref:Porin n=1 Tax=Microvirga lupini TaxID=420324 RepID=A0A7W4VNW4_9HYPH|nr:hypothetical protein [Microvirga lupini]